MQLKQIIQQVSFNDVANALADMYPEEMFSETGEFLLPSYEEVFKYLTEIQPKTTKFNLRICLEDVIVTSATTGSVQGDPQLLSWADWMAMDVTAASRELCSDEMIVAIALIEMTEFGFDPAQRAYAMVGTNGGLA